MVKIYKIPISKLNGHPIVPVEVEGDVTFIDGDSPTIVFQVHNKGVVAFSEGNVTRFREEEGINGAVSSSCPSPIGSSIWESARMICESYIKSYKD